MINGITGHFLQFLSCLTLTCFAIPFSVVAQTPNLPQDANILNANHAISNAPQTIPADAARLIHAYPAQNLRYQDNKIIFPDGDSITFDDGKTKTFEEMLNDSDIEDMFRMSYDTENEPQYLQDAGRSRCEAFFKKMYGSSAEKVKKQLVSVNWFGSRLKFSSTNGAAEQLQAIANEINREHPDLKKYIKSSGTFYWRKVRQAERMSAHSYGIAIDIAVPFSDYWHWAFSKASETDHIGYKNRIPLELVRIFEKHGFVWGGRWYHFDTMHFEYRPEISSPVSSSSASIN